MRGDDKTVLIVCTRSACRWCGKKPTPNQCANQYALSRATSSKRDTLRRRREVSSPKRIADFFDVFCQVLVALFVCCLLREKHQWEKLKSFDPRKKNETTHRAPEGISNVEMCAA